MASSRQQLMDLITALAAALDDCNEAGTSNEQIIARIMVNPIDLHTAPDAWKHAHVVDVTESGLVEALKMFGTIQPTPITAGAVDATNTPEDANRFAREYGNLAGQIADVLTFDEAKAREVQASVIDRRGVDLLTALEAIDDVLGDIADPYADEDGDL